jgi:pimeloyl-ACP methyl ester carboxylesterase
MVKILAILCLAVAASVHATAQHAAIDAPPGRLIALGDRKLHVHCTGSGSPTVVIEAGASSFAIDFSLVQTEIAQTNRVCSYDRAGMGWSDARPAVDTPTRVLSDLRAMLVASGEKPPYVMVGASFGALYVRLYQLEYPDDVVGLVLIDPATENRLFTLFEGRMVTIGSLTAEQLLTTLPASGSVPNRAGTRPPQTGAPFDRLPRDRYETRIRLDERLIAAQGASVPAEIVREGAEANRAMFARLLESRTANPAPMSNTPTVVLTRGIEMTPGIAENHAGLAALSTNSRHTVVPDAGHEIHLFAPSTVVQAIRDVSVASREGTPLPKRP